MGCNNSVDAKVVIRVEFNLPVFKSQFATVQSTLRSTLKEFCRKAVSANIDSAYLNKSKSFKISCKDKQYNLTDLTHIYDLRLESTDIVKIEAVLLDNKSIEIILKFFGNAPKEVTQEVTRSSLIRSLINNPDSRVLLGYLELDHGQTIEDYDIGPKTRLHIIEDLIPDEVQLWKLKKSGIVLETICMNSNCVAYKQRISISLGFGEFNLQCELSSDNQRHCPACDSPLGKVSKLGYAHCKIAYNVVLPDGTTGKVFDKIVNYSEVDIKNLPNIVIVSEF